MEICSCGARELIVLKIKKNKNIFKNNKKIEKYNIKFVDVEKIANKNLKEGI